MKTSGLLAALQPEFEKDTGYRLEVRTTGSGKAIQLAREGNFDILVVHAPRAEQELIEQGYTEKRVPFMRNYFLIVGPPQDPAHIKGTSDAAEAFRRIAASKSLFISRADDSGTHQKEIAIWQASGREPVGTWYYEAGLGMGQVLKLANEKMAYTLIDDGTWLASRNSSPLTVLVQDLERLDNTYSLILLSKKKLPQLNHTGAAVFEKWLLSEKGKTIIDSMVIDGKPLFTVLTH